ncbi:MAG TPA: lytic transglycosylase domain-containing protein, partial [Firmicutes bacterium]|nr:lytic transglycosylase domain-containing protein [Bacillota bacterium]
CGLMQLMPATAAGAARSLGITLREEDLLRPEINLRLGTWYLSRMIAACGGDVVQALAAYNGGLANVHRWAASPVFRGREGFPAAISYPETREYVTKVAASYLVYRYMYGE